MHLIVAQVAYLIVDEMHAEHPELVKDAFWDEGVPEELPYTLAAEEFRAEPWQGSAAEVNEIFIYPSVHSDNSLHLVWTIGHYFFRSQCQNNRVSLSILTQSKRSQEQARRTRRSETSLSQASYLVVRVA